MTIVQLQIAGRGAEDAPFLGDLLDQIADYFEILSGVASSISGDEVEQFGWKVVGLSKNSPATITVEAVARPGFPYGPELARNARDQATIGLRELRLNDERPLHFTDNVLDAADRFLRRVARSLSETSVVDDVDSGIASITFKPEDAVPAINNISYVRTSDPVHPYKEIGSFEGFIENVGTDGWNRPYIIVKNRVSDNDVKCFLSGAALRALEMEPVANVVWRKRRVVASGILRFRSLGRLSQADINRLDFADPEERLPQARDIIDKDFTDGLSSAEFIERLRSGEA